MASTAMKRPSALRRNSSNTEAARRSDVSSRRFAYNAFPEMVVSGISDAGGGHLLVV